MPTSSYGFFDIAAPRCSSVAEGTMLRRSNAHERVALCGDPDERDSSLAVRLRGRWSRVATWSVIVWILPARSASKTSCRVRRAT